MQMGGGIQPPAATPINTENFDFYILAGVAQKLNLYKSTENSTPLLSTTTRQQKVALNKIEKRRIAERRPYVTSNDALIVPQELPSILSLVYSNIPPVKKGTDSRLGFGFRLGDHADFQVMLELGPQKDTRPIGMSSSSNSKRNVNQQDYVPVSEKPHDNEPMSWLKNWSKDMHKTKSQVFPSSPELGSAVSKIQTVPLISESALKQLQMLYKKQPSSYSLDDSTVTVITETTTQMNKTKAKITAELMDVELN